MRSRLCLALVALCLTQHSTNALAQVAGTPQVIEDDTVPLALRTETVVAPVLAGGSVGPEASVETSGPEWAVTEDSMERDVAAVSGDADRPALDYREAVSEDADESIYRRGERDGDVPPPPPPPPPSPPPPSPYVCLGNPGPCIKVIGIQGSQFWVVNRQTFHSWGQSAPSVTERIKRSARYLIRHFPPFRLADGAFVPEINKLNTDYLILPMCQRNVRYRNRWEVRLPQDGERTAEIRCE